MLLDIHTHHRPAVPGEAVFNLPLPVAGNERMDGLASDAGWFSAGIHPWRVPEARNDTWDWLERVVTYPSVVAIGEVGLDKRCAVEMSLQKEAFERQIRLSESVGKPLIIHCVKAFNELTELKKKHRPHVPWVVHGFRNNRHVAERLLREGIRISLGEKYAPDVLQCIPPEQLLAETDESTCPIRELIARMAAAKNREADSLCEQMDENARKLFFRS